jgi:hypothetical protein
MSLYKPSNSNQASAVGSLVAKSGFPAWMLVFTMYLSVSTSLLIIINCIFIFPKISEFINKTGFYIGITTSTVAIISLWIFLFRRTVFWAYYLILTQISYTVIHLVQLAGYAEKFKEYTRSIVGLDVVFHRVFFNLYDSTTENRFSGRVLDLLARVAVVAFCVLLLYFHNKRQSKVLAL